MAALRLFIMFALLFLAPPTARAADTTAPDRAGLVAFWEKSVQQDAHVLVFKKTNVKDVYDFETDFFPYKGRLRLLNAAVSKNNDGYSEGFYNGIIEVELLDAKPDFFKKYAMSYSAWVQQNNFYYDVLQSVWFPASDWAEYYAASRKSSSTCAVTTWKNYANTLGPVGFVILVLGFAVWAARKQHKKAWAANDKIMERQAQALRMTEESLVNQKTQISLLQGILESLQKR